MRKLKMLMFGAVLATVLGMSACDQKMPCGLGSAPCPEPPPDKKNQHIRLFLHPALRLVDVRQKWIAPSK